MSHNSQLAYWEVTETNHLVGGIHSEGKAAIAGHGSSPEGAEVEHRFAIMEERVETVVRAADRRVADDMRLRIDAGAITEVTSKRAQIDHLRVDTPKEGVE